MSDRTFHVAESLHRVNESLGLISLRPVKRLLMMSGQLVGQWLLSAGNSRLVVRLRPVSRLLRVVGRSGLVISLRPVCRLLMNSGQWVGWFLLTGS